MTIVEFLNARLDEHESGWKTQKRAEADGCIPSVFHFGRSLAEYMLAEIAAKRAIIEEYERAHERRRAHPDDLASAGALLALLGVIKQLTSVYSDRPDYNPEWRP